MTRFEPAHVLLEGGFTVGGAVEEVFGLFSPAGERLWVPEWEPEFLRPADPGWEEGQVFRTVEEQGEAVWVVGRLDRASHRVRYHRVEPGRYVATVEVVCRAAGEAMTEVATTYGFLGLSPSGNQEIGAMSQADYDAKMRRWAGWIEGHLSRR